MVGLAGVGKEAEQNVATLKNKADELADGVNQINITVSQLTSFASQGIRDVTEKGEHLIQRRKLLQFGKWVRRRLVRRRS